MRIKNFTLLILAISLHNFKTFSQSLIHNYNYRYDYVEKHVFSAGTYYSYSQPGGAGNWIIPILAYQNNLRLDNINFKDANAFFLQLGVSATPNRKVKDTIPSTYTLMEPGYINAFATFYILQQSTNNGLTFYTNVSTGIKLISLSPIKKNPILTNGFLQYYIGLGAGIGYKRLFRYNIQYNALFHDITDHARVNFRELYQGRSLHGYFINMNLRVFLTPDKCKNISAYSEVEWRRLGKSYQQNKTIAFGLGVTYTINN